MAATVIDELIVTLGLDPKNFTNAQKKALEDFKKSRKGFEEEGKRTSEVFSKLKLEALGFVAALVGASSIEQFAVKLTATDAGIGRMARTLNSSVGELAAWRNVAELTGGTADGMAGSIHNLVQAFSDLRLTGQSPIQGVLRTLSAYGLRPRYGKGGALDYNDFLLQLSDVATKINNPAVTENLFARLGIDQGTINTLLQGHDAIQKLLTAQKQNIAATQGDTDAAIELTSAWNSAAQAATALGRARLTQSTPAVVSALHELGDLFQGRFDWSDQGRDPVWRRLFGSDAAPSPAGGAGIPAAGRRLLGAIAGSESAGAYNVEYGGARFSSYADHPNHPHLITSGPNKGKYSTAAGRYQFTIDTWRQAKAALGLKDFSPASQDRAAWWLAQRDYKARTGRDLSAALAAGDPNVGSVLSRTWTSLPGGIEQHQTPAQFAAAAGGATHNNTRSDVHIGTIVIHTQATGAVGIAQDIGPALRRTIFAAQANGGPN